MLSDDWTEADAEEIEDAAHAEESQTNFNAVENNEASEQLDTEGTENTTNDDEKGFIFDEADVILMNENQLSLQDEDASMHHDDEEDLTPGVRILVNMGFSVEDSKKALFYGDGDMNIAISDLTGEQKEWHRMRNELKDASIKLKHTAEVVRKAVGDGAAQVKQAVQDKDVPSKALVVAHQAKLTLRSIGREVETFNEKYHVTDALATIGVAVAAAMLAKGNAKLATTTAAVAGSAYVAGEGMKFRRCAEIYE